jgi:hypothetical protein
MIAVGDLVCSDAALVEIARFEPFGFRVELARRAAGRPALVGADECASVDVRMRAEMIEVARPPEGIARIGRAGALGVVGAGERRLEGDIGERVAGALSAGP